MDLVYAEGAPLRILDFDIECQPGAWFGGDFTTKRILSIAAGWIVDGECQDAECVTRMPRKGSTAKMLRWFKRLYDEADIVTGHFIRGYDLSVLQGGMMRYGLEPLAQKLTQDTKLDMLKASGISKSQENLGALYELEHPKVPMTTVYWEEAQDLSPEGREMLRERNLGDIFQHTELRERMLAAGTLGNPKLWLPAAHGSSKYAP